ncbi:hypothetical protein H3H32_08875 [Spirosoma foliorum]|uniref:Uncharacterized protein n=1 Tax=Spirosoma foliorum TaxID=2710596 RepID=A0A7G5H1J7_9BACT|nr:hypothetical protein H3H32_08875 [Spirosoma foliorum]
MIPLTTIQPALAFGDAGQLLFFSVKLPHGRPRQSSSDCYSLVEQQPLED